MSAEKKDPLFRSGQLTAVVPVLAVAAVAGIPQAAAGEGKIVHDGEYQFLRQQHGERWDAEDKEIDKMLSDIRSKHGGERPNILYILIDIKMLQSGIIAHILV